MLQDSWTLQAAAVTLKPSTTSLQKYSSIRSGHRAVCAYLYRP